MADFFDDALSVIGAVAPGIATAIGGPFAGLAVKAITGALGMDEGSSKSDVLTAVMGASPDQLLAIKEADQTFKLEMERLNVDILTLDKEDRESARVLQAETKSVIPAVIAVLVFAGFFGILATLMFAEVPDKSVTPLNIMLGALAGLVIQVANFYFGSSAGSKAKTTALTNLTGGATSGG